MWGPARVSGQGRERYFLLVVDILIPWIRTVRLRLGERFREDLPVLRLHSDRGAPHWLSHGDRSYLHDPCGCSPFSPTLRWTKQVGDASVFRVWGSLALVRDTFAHKLSARAFPCVFLGFPPVVPGRQFYHPTLRRVLSSVDVTFDELVPFFRLFPYRSAPPLPTLLFLAPGPPPVDPLPPQGPAPSGVSQVDPEGDLDAPDIPTPRSYTEAITGPYSSHWQAATDAEIGFLEVHRHLRRRSSPVSGEHWYVDFRVKRMPGSPPVIKSRYVARGFSHRQGVDYFHTFSPTPKMTTLRMLLLVAAQHDYELHSLDFSTAFLQGSLHEEIWLRCPPGFTGSFPVGTQWSLRRPIYSLHQAPRECHNTLRTTLAALGFAPSTANPSLFLRTDTSLPPFYVLVYVDNLVFATADTKALTFVKSKLQKRHTCTDLSELRSYLGMQITRDGARRTITLTHSHMVHQVLQRFGFQFSSPQPTPLPTGHSLSAPPSDKSVEPSGLYPELVGCLMYLMTCTRPNLAYPLSLLARYVAPVI
ncbi:unnamed protein product [Closterium sp. NIES-53]